MNLLTFLVDWYGSTDDVVKLLGRPTYFPVDVYSAHIPNKLPTFHVI